MSFFFSCCGCCSNERGVEFEHLKRDEEPSESDLGLSMFAAMWVRSSGAFTLERILEQIGTRQRKAFVWVAHSSGTRGGNGGFWRWIMPSAGRLVLTVSVCSIGLHERSHLERALMLSASHPLLLPILAVDFPRPDRVVVVRTWCRSGSLRDILHAMSPERSVNAKYDRVGSPLSEGKCAELGRALLDALLVIRPLGARACL